MAKAQGNLDKFNKDVLNDPSLGATPAERKAAAEKIAAVADIKKSGDEFEAALNDPKNNLTEAEKKRARELRVINTDLHFGQNAVDSANKADAALKRGDIDGAYPYATSAAGDMRAAKDKEDKQEAKLKNNAQQMSQAATPQAQAQIAKDSDNLRLDRNEAHTSQGVANVRAAGAGEQDVGAKAHAQVAKQAFVQKAAVESTKGDDALGDEPSAPAQVASTSRKSIDIPDLNGKPVVSPESWMLAQLGKPMEAEKALEPELKPENQQPKAPKTTLET